MDKHLRSFGRWTTSIILGVLLGAFMISTPLQAQESGVRFDVDGPPHTQFANHPLRALLASYIVLMDQFGRTTPEERGTPAYERQVAILLAAQDLIGEMMLREPHGLLVYNAVIQDAATLVAADDVSAFQQNLLSILRRATVGALQRSIAELRTDRSQMAHIADRFEALVDALTSNTFDVALARWIRSVQAALASDSDIETVRKTLQSLTLPDFATLIAVLDAVENDLSIDENMRQEAEVYARLARQIVGEYAALMTAEPTVAPGYVATKTALGGTLTTLNDLMPIIDQSHDMYAALQASRRTLDAQGSIAALSAVIEALDPVIANLESWLLVLQSQNQPSKVALSDDGYEVVAATIRHARHVLQENLSALFSHGFMASSSVTGVRGGAPVSVVNGPLGDLALQLGYGEIILVPVSEIVEPRPAERKAAFVARILPLSTDVHIAHAQQFSGALSGVRRHTHLENILRTGTSLEGAPLPPAPTEGPSVLMFRVSQLLPATAAAGTKGGDPYVALGEAVVATHASYARSGISFTSQIAAIRTEITRLRALPR